MKYFMTDVRNLRPFPMHRIVGAILAISLVIDLALVSYISQVTAR